VAVVPLLHAAARKDLVSQTVLITGGAGFIGSHLSDELLREGYRVRALDSLVEQVHGTSQRPEYLTDEVELIAGDVRNAEVVRGALEGVDAVVHLAARVGVGQSMYELAEYAGANTAGTGVLLEQLLDHPVRKLVVASSMSVYGEGAYEPVPAVERPREQLERGDWEPRGPNGEELRPVPTPESKEPSLASVYALTKYDQERMCLLYGAAYGVPTVALRFFNVYGPRQSLSNPYTGVLAIFASRLLNDRRPLVYEDGGQRRDFVNVADVARACRLALERDGADGRPVNVGSGRSASVLEIAAELSRVLGKDLEPEIPGKFRAGDIRHCFADVTVAREALGFEAQVPLEDGMAELAAWLEGQVATDRFDEAAAELTERGLTT
jgi:dTDP-L-rhamnose 4-epimerase